MSGRLPTYERRLTVQPAGVVQTPVANDGQAALAQGLNSASDSFGALAREITRDSALEQREAEKVAGYKAEEEGRTVAFRDQNGNYVPIAQGDPLTMPGRVKNAAVQSRVLSDAEIQADEHFQQLSKSETGMDPAAFKAASDGYAKTRVDALRQTMPWLAEAAETVIRRRQVAYQGGVIGAAWNKERSLQASSWGTTLDMYRGDVRALVDAGITEGPQLEQAKQAFANHLRDGLATQNIDEAGARVIADTLTNEVRAIPIARQAETVARTQGPVAARRWLDETLSHPDMAALGLPAMNAARAEGNRRISLAAQDRSLEQQQARSTAGTLMGNIRSGVNVPADRIEAEATRADRVGLPDQAQKLRALNTIQGEAGSLRAMALPDLMQAGVAAKAGNPDDPVSGMRAELVAGLVQDRIAALKADPVGFARQQPQVQAALTRVQAGDGTMADVVRAQDAVLAANGVDPVGHRIVPQAEIAQLKDAVTNLPVTGDPAKGTPGAADMLKSMFDRYGPENRFRVWNDLRGAGLPPTLRPAALLMAGQDPNTLRVFLEATRLGPEAMAKAIGDDGAKQVRAKVESELATLRQTVSGNGQDLALVMDATDAATTVALFHASSGATAAAAAQRAVQDVVGGALRVVDEDLGKFRVPRGVDFDAPAFRNVMGRLLGRGPTNSEGVGDLLPGVSLTDPNASRDAAERFANVRFRIPPGAVSASLTDRQQQEAYRSSLQSFGRFRTAPDGGGVWLQDSAGRPVLTEDGQPYGIRFGEEKSPEGPAALRPRQVSSAVQDQRERQAIAFFQGQGWTPEQAAGLAAQFAHESGYDPGAVGDGGLAVGSLQWHPDRRQALARAGYRVEGASFEDQLRAAQYELTQGGEKAAGDAIRGARTAEDAARIASTRWVRPKDTATNERERAATATRLRGRIG